MTAGARTVSVVVPTYNSRRTVEACLRSIQRQSYYPVETVVVDNLSVDGTQEIAHKLGAKVVEHRGTRGSARRRGLTYSTGDYLLFVDSDQVLEERVVEECVKICEAHRAEAVKIPEVFIGEEFWSQCSALWKNKVEEAEGAEGSIPRFYVRTAIREHDFDESLVFWEDYYLYRRVANAGGRCAWITSRIYHKEPMMVEMLIKSYVYGRALDGAVGLMGKAALLDKIDLAFRTALSVVTSGNPLLTKIGCMAIVVLKAFAMIAGVMHRRFAGGSVKRRLCLLLRMFLREVLRRPPLVLHPV